MTGSAAGHWLTGFDAPAMHAVMDFALADPDRKVRHLDQVHALAKAFALCGTGDEAKAIRNDVKLFADVRSAIVKLDHEGSGPREPGSAEVDTAIAQLVSEAVVSEGVIDFYAAAGIDSPTCRSRPTGSSTTVRVLTTHVSQNDAAVLELGDDDYPPDKEERAIELVLELAQLLADGEAV